MRGIDIFNSAISLGEKISHVYLSTFHHSSSLRLGICSIVVSHAVLSVSASIYKFQLRNVLLVALRDSPLSHVR